MKKLSLASLVLIGLSAVVSCKKNDVVDTSTPSVANFNYSTSKSIAINITLKSQSGNALENVPVKVYAPAADGTKGDLLYTALTDASGIVSGNLAIPAYLDTLIVDPAYIGLIRDVKTYLVNKTLTCTIGGVTGFAGNVVPYSTVNPVAIGARKAVFDINGVSTKTIFKSLADADASGVPKNLEPTLDVISDEMLKFLNYSLPESKSVAVLHPDFLKSTATSNINIAKKADVWITFVSEGAGYYNTLGFYKYKTGSAPKTLSDVDSIFFIYPNCSLPGSGGNLKSGSKVKIGTFEPGTTIGLVVYSNGWQSGSKVNTNATAFFTDANLNPEKNADLKKHTVLLKYTDSKKKDYYICGFDDQNREGGCDNDFNDVLFYATSNPIDAIDPTGVAPIDQPIDTDGDTVSDLYDAYPKDATRAYDNYYPSATTWGTLAFEDLWPGNGDYDLNDLVVRYRYKMVSNAQNKVVEMYADYAPVAAGAQYKDGFGVQFSFAPSLIKSVTGQKIDASNITLNSYGTEAKQSKAVIIPFDDYNKLVRNTNYAGMINTVPGKAKIAIDTARLLISFASPITTATLGIAPFNPFLISNLSRGHEVHLPNYVPTDLANTKLFGTGIDASIPAQGIYYRTVDNMPFALSFVETFAYPIEQANIKEAYLNFAAWAASGGTLYTDWYKNAASSYRNTKKIY